MPAINFKAQFVAKIQAGTKRHTIRARRVRPVKVGDRLFLYCGMRHKGAFRILPDAVTCSEIQNISIEDLEEDGIRITVDGYVLDVDEVERLAYADGFESFAEMVKFWEGSLPFFGNIIHWRPSEAGRP
jgi:hypothetical protein